MTEQTRYFPERFKIASQFYTTGRPTYPKLLSRRVERFVDRALSFASTWEGRPGSREEDLVHEARAAIAKHANGEGLVHEVSEGHALIARRLQDMAAN